ncbi:MAG: AAA family ATPase [Prosthecobacter sp.]|nr:AAA family ATPase [Prosthecobacter sp.]
MKAEPTGKAAAGNDRDQARRDRDAKGQQQIDATILNGLRDYMDAMTTASGRRFSQAQLATRLGISSSYVSRAFGGTFIGLVKEFEEAALKLLEGASKRRVDNSDLSKEGFLVEPMRDFLDTVLHTGDIGVGWNPAGKGKTMGIRAYMEGNPLAIYVTATKSFAGWRCVRSAVLHQVSNKRLQPGETWDDFLRRKFTDSGHLLIIDNAHLLTQSARQWIAYDWHDGTRCPVALVGNPEIVAQWKKDDQLFSRVGMARNITPKTQATDIARAMIHLFLPDADGDKDLVKMATEVVKKKGACRALRKHLLLAREIAKGGKYANPCAWFRAAHTQLLSEFKFAEDGTVIGGGVEMREAA